MLDIQEHRVAAVPIVAMRSMFAARKHVFVDLLKWQLPVLDERYELDGFDDEHAHYLILTGRDGSHLGSARLLPTLRPHLLDTLYPSLCGEGPLRGEKIYEITRFCLDRRLNAQDRRIVRDRLVRTLVGHALSNGMTSYTAIAERSWARQILAFGWKCRPLGRPQLLDGSVLSALQIEISDTTMQRLDQAGVIGSAPEHSNARAAA